MKTSYRTGLAAEALCRLALRLKGYRILASRYKSPMGEIDIVARRGKTVALIEVKARPTHDEALEAIHAKQRRRLEQAARDFLARHAHYADHNLQFDVMLVTRRRWPRHIRDAWRPDN